MSNIPWGILIATLVLTCLIIAMLAELVEWIVDRRTPRADTSHLDDWERD